MLTSAIGVWICDGGERRTATGETTSGERTADSGQRHHGPSSGHWAHSSAGAPTGHGSGIVVVIMTIYKCQVSCCDGSPVSKSCSASSIRF